MHQNTKAQWEDADDDDVARLNMKKDADEKVRRGRDKQARKNGREEAEKKPYVGNEPGDSLSCRN